MKDEKKKNIKMLAEEIVALEESCQSKNNVSESLHKLEQIIQTLSLEDMLAIDEYILEKKLLTK